MGKTTIQWCMNPDGTPGEVWNPVTGCQKVSQGCKNCYAERIANRFWGERKFTDVWCHEDRLAQPLHWKKPRRVFVNSMSDLFHEDVPDEFITSVFMQMSSSKTSQHKFMILTKRADRMSWYMNHWYEKGGWVWAPSEVGKRAVSAWPLPNVWLGVSVEDQKAADERIPYLLKTPAAVRFLSCEPLLGPVDLSKYLMCQWTSEEVDWPKSMHLPDGYPPKMKVARILPRIDWVIAGGESGPGARPMQIEWARSLRDQCQSAHVPFFFKQFGEFKPTSEYRDGKVFMSRVGKKAAGRLLDGREWNEFPA
jgi:protein gp37